MTETEVKQKLNAVYIFNSPIVHAGHILELWSIADLYEKIYVLVYDSPQIINTEAQVMYLEKICTKFTDKYIIVKHKNDFKNLTNITKDIHNLVMGSIIITTDTKVYSNLASKGFRNVRKIQKAIGWEDADQATAYHRGYIFHRFKIIFGGK